MALLSPKAIEKILGVMLPWSAAHPEKGSRLVPLSERLFSRAGYTGIFQKGDIVFTQSQQEGIQSVEGSTRPAIYVVEDTMEWSKKKGFQIFWRLVLIGGYGPPVVALYYQHPYGENPHVYVDDYFTDYGHGSLPRLNYYVNKVVNRGKTVWDIEWNMG